MLNALPTATARIQCHTVVLTLLQHYNNTFCYLVQFKDFQHNSKSYIRSSSFYLMLANDTEIKNIIALFAHVFLTLNVPSPGKCFFPYSYMYIGLILLVSTYDHQRPTIRTTFSFCLLNLPIL